MSGTGLAEPDGAEQESQAVVIPLTPAAGVNITLETKLHAPGQRKEWVERPALVRYLSDTTAKLILIAAPAGYGKTTIVAQWRASVAETRPFAWISLDGGDNDPVRLWWHVASALQRACPEARASAILRPLRAQVPDLVETVLPVLVNELAAVQAPVVLVFDDYHVIRERACHEQFEFLLGHLTPPAQVVLITRADPPLPLARLRATGDMAEIRMRDLRFGPAEAAALVRAVAAVPLGEPDVADLIGRTEGWPAGVYLAALSLRGHRSPGSFVREFTGDNRFVVDFLAEEVTSRQPPEVRQFLMRTSILDRFTAPLGDAVAGTSNAADIIDVLDRENLFLIALDDNRRWFRYHHLFAQMLRSQLARAEPGIMPELHGRASAWHRRSGLAEEAIDHALAAGDVAGAIDLLAKHWYPFVDTGRVATVRAWIRSVGDRTGDDPLAAHCAAWAAALTGERDSVRRWLPVVEAGQDESPLPDGMRSLKFSAALLHGTFGFDGLRVMRESAATAVELEDDPRSPWYGLARAVLGFSLYLTGSDGAAAAAEQAVLGEASPPLLRMVALAVASLIAAAEGRLAQAEEHAAAARRIADDGDLGDIPQISLVRLGVGMVHWQHGRLAEARGEFEGALRSRRRWFGMSPWPTVETLLRLAPVLLDMGDRRGAAGLIAEARDALISMPDGAGALQARLKLLERRLAAATAGTPLAEPLTEREEAVLRLLRGTLSLREIGQELYLSANTIKSHTRAIYRKLGVTGRSGAVERGRELGIL
jgi:ATP/maltotriose-dependent transcriptional regulator MalT